MRPHAHTAAADALECLRCAVVTVSDTRTEATDRSGALMIERLREDGHEIASRHIIPDSPDVLSELMHALAGIVDAVLLSGGTGVSQRDNTYEVIAALLEKELRGFGELFRMLSYEEIGAAAMLSRATGGIFRSTLFFAMPGSPGAVRLALDKLILPELKHLVAEVRKQKMSA